MLAASTPLKCVYAAPGADYVLCLYDVDNRQAGRLRALYSSEAVQFRGWKSDAATRAGIYSARFRAANKPVLILR
jgi:protein-disulfide isomerase